MSYTVYELKPQNPILIIDNIEIELLPINLHLEVYFAEKYESLTNVFSLLKEKPMEIIEVVWALVKYKQQFSYSFTKFRNFILSSKDPLNETSKRLTACWQLAVNISRPLIKNQKRQKEIQEVMGQTSKGPCYATYFDKIAKRYGYSLDEFYNLSLRQLHLLLKIGDDESYKELEVQAALQGKKLKPRMEFADITEEQEQDQEKQAADALAELRKRYEENKDK